MILRGKKNHVLYTTSYRVSHKSKMPKKKKKLNIRRIYLNLNKHFKIYYSSKKTLNSLDNKYIEKNAKELKVTDTIYI